MRVRVRVRVKVRVPSRAHCGALDELGRPARAAALGVLVITPVRVARHGAARPLVITPVEGRAATEHEEGHLVRVRGRVRVRG